MDFHFEKQQKRINELFEDVESIEEVLVQQKKVVQEIIDTKDTDIVFKLNQIDDIVKSKTNIIEKLTIPDFQIKFSADSNGLMVLEQFVNTMHQYKIEPTDKTDAQTLLEESFLIHKSWICHYCNHQNATVVTQLASENSGKKSSRRKIKPEELS